MIIYILLSFLLVLFIPRMSIILSLVNIALYIFLDFGYYTFPWINEDFLTINLSFVVDNLSLRMALMAEAIGFCIKLYSFYYFKNNKNFLRIVHFFLFGMIGLVFSDHFLHMFFSWELMGLCSYLLIGYYGEKKEAGEFSFKAFILNKQGDIFFLLAIALIYFYLDSFSIKNFLDNLSFFEGKLLKIGTLKDFLALFLGIAALAKSAQLLFFIWLPDAMVGPSPGSALIHAATMVTGGVFLLLRLGPLFQNYQEIILPIGVITGVIASFLALFQEKIKAILAYSTVSQLSIMFIAVGLTLPEITLLHLIIHGFFKSCLFLVAGVLIHETHKESLVDLKGIGRYFPFTATIFTLALLGLIGFPGFGSFFSKEIILSEIYNTKFFYFFIFITLCTNIYSFKIISILWSKQNQAVERENFSYIKRFSLIPLIIFSFGFWVKKVFIIQEVDHFFLYISIGIMILSIFFVFIPFLFKEYFFIKNKLYIDQIKFDIPMKIILNFSKIFELLEKLFEKIFIIPFFILNFIESVVDFIKGRYFYNPLYFIVALVFCLYWVI